VRSVTVAIPPPAESPFVFRRAFLHAIRKAIGDAQIAGELDETTAVECFKAFAPADPQTPVRDCRQ
jgi:hypothetical protein